MKKAHKKSLLFLATGMMLFSLVGCNKTPGGYSGPIHLLFGGYQADQTKNTIDSMSWEILNYKIQNKESMILVVYGDEGCGCWVNFQPIAAKANYQKQLAIKKINVGDFGTNRSTFGIDLSAVMPCIALFENGTLIKQVSYGNSASTPIFVHQDKFNEFLDNNVVYPTLGYEISEADLDYKISQNETFNLYVGRCGCGDCASINNGGLKEYASTITEEINDPIYYFDMQSYRGTSDYQPTKAKYGLTEGSNPVFGYGTDEEGGAFPTLQRRTGNTVTDMIVVLNDRVTGSEAPYTISSYFTTTRVNAMQFITEDKEQYVLDGKELTEEQKYNWRLGYQKSLHDPILKMFLETYVK